jgi:hypothetical protein
MCSSKKMAHKRSLLGFGHAKQIGLALLAGLGKRSAWLLVLAVLVLASIWLLYSNVWQPLRQDVPLPAGVAVEQASLDIEALRSINTARVSRLEGMRRSFTSFADLFFQSATVPEDR